MKRKNSNPFKGILFIVLWTFSLCIFAQNITVRGIVTDASNEPLIGVTVRIEGTSTGTITDMDGNFTFSNIPSNAVLEVSYVGMVSQTIPVNGRTTINVVLREDSEVLEEVVVVGYGVQKKESIVGSIVQTTSDDIKRTGNVTDLKQALTGQLPGVVTLTSSGEPGGVGGGNNATEIYIRGRNTWNGGQPELPDPSRFNIHADGGDHCYIGLRASLCHGWASGPTAWLSEHVLGIQVMEPGLKTVRIRPNLGNLKFAEGTFPTPYGEIYVKHTRQEDGTIESEIHTPEEVRVIQS